MERETLQVKSHTTIFFLDFTKMCLDFTKMCLDFTKIKANAFFVSLVFIHDNKS